MSIVPHNNTKGSRGRILEYCLRKSRVTPMNKTAHTAKAILYQYFRPGQPVTH